MDGRDRPIAVVQGAASGVIQQQLLALARWVAPARVAGVVEQTPESASAQLVSLADGGRFPLFQDLGPQSTACGLDGESVVAACEAVRRDIAAGCDLLVLSKFGRLEAERSGLAAAFAAGLEAGAPIITSVAPRYEDQWAAFAAPMFVTLPPELPALQAWWRAVGR